MKIVSVLKGRAMQIFAQDEVRPERDIYLPQFVELVMSKYGFLRHSSLAEAGDKGIKFEQGRLAHTDGDIAIENLDFYNDGVVVICRDTELAEIVLDDAIEWAIRTLAFRRPKVMPQRTYASWIVVDFDQQIGRIFEKFGNLQALIASSYERAYGDKLNFEMLRVAFNVDPRTLPPYTNTEYTIDRRGNATYDLERYFCTAPLRTAKHLDFLNELEATLK